MRLSCVVAAVLFLSGLTLSAQDVGNRPTALGDQAETIVYPVRAGSASQIAQSLEHLYQDLHIATQDENNLVLIRVGADLRGEIIGVLEQLDREKKMITVHAYLLSSYGSPLSVDETAGLSGPLSDVLQLIDSLERSDQLAIENRIEVSTIENRTALVQTGARLPVVVGATVSPSRARINNYQQINAGTLFSVAARETPEGAIAMEINFEQSKVEATDDDAGPTPASVSTLTQQTTVRCADGHAVLAGTMVGKPNTSSRHAYLVVAASSRGASASQAERPKRTSGPFGRFGETQSRGARSRSSAGQRLGSDGQAPTDRLDAIVQSIFNRADRDSNGVLTGEELSTRATSAERADIDKNGRVTLQEYKNFVAARMGVEQSDSKTKSPRIEAEASKQKRDPRFLAYYTKLLAKYDEDNDGKLNEEEWSKMQTDPADADVDGDAYITAEELTDWRLKNR